MTVFNELDFRLSVVKRWSVVSTLRQQSVAEHSFNVIIIAERVALNWFQITDPVRLYYITRRARYHDYYESVTGDAPTYMKRFINEAAAHLEIEANLTEDIDIGVEHELDRIIVKIADFLDALIFLRMEVSHGNRSVVNHLRKMEERFREYLLDHEEKFTNEQTAVSVFDHYGTEIVDVLFSQNGQFMSELHGFPR